MSVHEAARNAEAERILADATSLATYFETDPMLVLSTDERTLCDALRRLLEAIDS